MRAAKLSMLLALAMVSAGCAVATPEPTITPVHFRVCQINQSGDALSQADTEQAIYGLQKAQIALGAHLYKVATKTPTALTFKEVLKHRCNMVVTTGDALAKLAFGAAVTHPKVQFLSVLSTVPAPGMGAMQLSNYSTIGFDVTSVGYLAGYAAASSTKTGVVGVVGGVSSQRTDEYLQGFSAGVSKLNATLSSSVRIVGTNQIESNYVGSNSDAAKVRSFVGDLADQGADVIFLAAGPASLGAGSVAVLRQTKLIFADSDAWFDPATADFKSHILTSAAVNLSVLIYNAVAVQLGVATPLPTPLAGNRFVGNLANQGTYLAPTHDLSFSPNLANELDQLTKQLMQDESTN
jgi:basic membrane protein A